MSEQRNTFFSNPLNGLIVGVVVGILAIIPMIVFDWPSHDTGTQVPVSEVQDAEGFVEDWEAMRSGTYYVESVFTRTAGDQETFTSTTQFVQRPPDTVSVANGNVTVTRNGEREVCPPAVDGATRQCRSGGAVDVDAERQAELTTVRSLVEGPSAIYVVTERNDGCHELELTSETYATRADLPWGTAAVFCFDNATGALTSSRFDRNGEAVDVTTATAIRGSVTDADFDALATA